MREAAEPFGVDRGSQPGSGIFAVDFHIWKRALALGINSAVSLLVLARGSGGDNSTTSWSVDAVERYTGISRLRAKDAIAKLEHHGIVELLRGGTQPRRRIKAANEVSGCPGYLGDLEAAEAALLSQLPLKESTLERSAQKRRLTERLVAKGRARWEMGTYEVWLHPCEPKEDITPTLVWLPNAIVDGVGGETAPLELVRQTQCLVTLRTLVEVYHFQTLGTWGGVDPLIATRAFETKELGQRGQFRVWGFEPIDACTVWTGSAFPRDDQWPVPCWLLEDPAWRDIFDSLNRIYGFERLVDLGLAAWIPCLFESGNSNAEMIFPVPTGIDPAFLSDDEREFGQAVRKAASSMIPHQIGGLRDNIIIAPAPIHITDVHVRGIVRTRYRANTTETQRWCAKTADLKRMVERFDAALN